MRTIPAIHTRKGMAGRTERLSDADLSSGSRFGLVKLTDRINASLEKHYWRWVFLFTLIFFACSIVRDLRTTMWFDELFTLYLAKLGSPQEIIAFNDASPPLYPIIVHWLLPIIGNDALALRLPATLGYCAMMVCLWAFCRRRLPAAFAFAATLLTFERGLYFATEGRAYGLVLGCAAGALLCWQMAAEGRRRSLGHCAARLVFGAHGRAALLCDLLSGAAVLSRKSCAGGLPEEWTSAYGPPWCRRRSFSGCTTPWWWRARTTGRTSGPKRLFRPIAPFYARFLLPPLILGGLAFFVVALLAGSSAHPRESTQKATLPLHEWTVGCGTRPAAAGRHCRVHVHDACFCRALHSVGRDRICPARGGGAVRGGTRPGCCCSGAYRHRNCLNGAIGDRASASKRQSFATAEGVRQELDKMARDGSEPIVVANAHAFMELSYYLDPPLRERLVFPLSRDLDLQYRGFDTDALTLGPLGQRGANFASKHMMRF